MCQFLRRLRLPSAPFASSTRLLFILRLILVLTLSMSSNSRDTVSFAAGLAAPHRPPGNKAYH